MSLGLGEFYSLACAVLWASAVILFRQLGDRLSPFTLNLNKNAIASVVLGLTIVVFAPFDGATLSARDWVLASISGIIGIALGDTFYFQALRRLGASRTGIVACLYSPFVVVLSFVFLAERLGAWQWAGFALVLAGVVLVSYKRDPREVSGRDLRVGLAYGVVSIFAMAVGIIMVKRILETESFLWIVEIRLVAGLLAMVALATARRQLLAVWEETKAAKRWGLLIVASLLGTYFSMLAWLAGYKYTDASIASVLNETASAFIVLFAWLFLREPMGWAKIVGVSLSLSGVVVIVSASG